MDELPKIPPEVLDGVPDEVRDLYWQLRYAKAEADEAVEESELAEIASKQAVADWDRCTKESRRKIAAFKHSVSQFNAAAKYHGLVPKEF